MIYWAAGGQPGGPQVDTATITTVLSTNHVDSEVLAHDAMRSGVRTRAHILLG